MVDLFPFQRETVDILKQGISKIVAHDVGTGKTIISIKYCQEMNYKYILVVCPAPLKENWKHEIEQFNEESVILEGKQEKREKLFKEYLVSDSKFLVCNYEQLNSKNSFLLKQEFDCIIADEVHRLKNFKSKTSKFAMKLKSKDIIALTATILTNNPLEVYSIVNFVKKNFFKISDFINEYAILGKKFHGPRIGWVMVPVDWKNLDKLHKIIEPYIIRKTKEEIFPQLPKRITKNYYVDLSVYEQNLHDFYKNEMKKSYDLETKDTFSYLSLMQQSCNGTRMLKLSESPNVGIIDKDENSKLKTLLEILNDFENYHKIIIFSKFKRMIYIIEEELKQKLQNVNIFTVTGDTEDKLSVVNNFNLNTSKSILLASDALNYGFNIPNNDVTIHFDLPWTKSKISQRDGRSERMEREKVHLVVSIIARNSFDKSVIRILNRKQKYSDKTVDGITDNEIIKELVR